MSSTKRKLAYAPSQSAAASASALDWRAAVTAEREAVSAIDSTWKDAERQERFGPWQASLERLIGTRAPTPRDAAYKLGRLTYLASHAQILRNQSGVILSPADHAEVILREGNDLEKGLLAVHQDLLTYDAEMTRLDREGGSAVARHAAAGSARDARKLRSSEEALVRTRAIRPANIAYKLHAAWPGMEPDHTELNTHTLPAILRDASVDSGNRLIASAFLDLMLLASEADGTAPPAPPSSDFAGAVTRFKAADAAFEAAWDKSAAAGHPDDLEEVTCKLNKKRSDAFLALLGTPAGDSSARGLKVGLIREHADTLDAFDPLTLVETLLLGADEDPGPADATPAEREWDDAARGVVAAYETDNTGALEPAVDRLLAATPYDIDGFRLLFEVVVTEAQGLGVRAVQDEEGGPMPLTDDRLCDSVGWPEHQPCVVMQDGKGLQAGLVHLRRTLDRMTGDAGAPWRDPE